MDGKNEKQGTLGNYYTWEAAETPERFRKLLTYHSLEQEISMFLVQNRSPRHNETNRNKLTAKPTIKNINRKMKTIDLLFEDSGLSLNELAEQSRLPEARLMDILKGRWTPSPKDRQKIAAALQVEPDAISWGHSMAPRNIRYHRYGLKEDF